MAKTPYWRDPFGPGEVIQRVRPAESFDYIHNPHRGTATFQRFNGDPVTPDWRWDDRAGPFKFTPFEGDANRLVNERYPRAAISYCRWIWSDIEPEKGKIRWDVFDGSLQAARQRGQTLQVRVQPYIGDHVPEWYWAMGGKAQAAPAGDIRREIDHNAPEYERHWGDLIRALGARYDGHPDLESFDIAYGGPCGEGGGNCLPETAERLVDIYLDSFRKTQLLSMLSTHGCAHAARRKDRRIGWRTDCFGDLRNDGRGEVPDRLCWTHMYDSYPMAVELDGVKDAWKRAPVTMETCWTVPYWVSRNFDIDWILAQGLKYHMTVFMPKSAYIPDEWRAKIDAFDRRLGYRFVLRQLTLPLEMKPGGEMSVRVFVDNVGVAPIYRPYRLAFRFRQGRRDEVVLAAADLREWLPDLHWFEEKIRFPEWPEKGEVKLDVGIVDETLKPKVRFAIRETDPDGWHPLTSMDAL